MKMYPSDFESAPLPIRITLLAALCQVRQAELTDGLVELLVQLVHKISVRRRRRSRDVPARPITDDTGQGTEAVRTPPRRRRQASRSTMASRAAGKSFPFKYRSAR
jgi:hypothetical protein